MPPDSVFPPDFGTMFITGPPDSTSPRLPDVVKRHLLRVPRVREVVRAAGLGHGDADAVHQQPRLAIGPPAIEEGAVRAERARVAGSGAHVLLAAEDGRDEHEERVIGAGGRNRGDDFVGQHGLPLRALDVHDRCFTGHGDGLLDAAHLELGVDRDGQERIQLQTRATHRGKTWQGEGHRVVAGPQVLDAVQPRAVGGGGTNLLDEGRARWPRRSRRAGWRRRYPSPSRRSWPAHGPRPAEAPARRVS